MRIHKGTNRAATIETACIRNLRVEETRQSSAASPPSLTPPCRFSAAGSSRWSRRDGGPGTGDGRLGQGIVCQESGEARPIEGVTARTAVEPRMPKPTNDTIELPKAPRVRGSSIVLVVASQLRAEDRSLRFQPIVTMLATPYIKRFERSPQALLHRLQMDRELASQARRRQMGEP